MSEYQYYEFLAIDRPLTPKQIEQVRRYSSRAEITATSFCNEYEWGDFRGSPKDFLRDFFDVFVYLANWGTRRLMFRLPVDLADVQVLETYCGNGLVSIDKTKGFLLIDIDSTPDDGGGDWVEPHGVMASLAPIRAEVLSGDIRALYIAWLHGLYQAGEDEACPEPPLPPGLRNLTAAQQSLMDFLEVDLDLFEVAAAASPDRSTDNANDHELWRWLIALPPDRKDNLLRRFVEADDPLLGAKLRQEYRHQSAAPVPSANTGRTVGQLFEAARQKCEKRQANEARERALAQARQDAELAAARAEHLRRLSSKQEVAWREVDALITKRQPKAYTEAVTLLVDLRDVATASRALAQFQQHINTLRQSHGKKGNLLDLMMKAGLTTK